MADRTFVPLEAVVALQQITDASATPGAVIETVGRPITDPGAIRRLCAAADRNQVVRLGLTAYGGYNALIRQQVRGAVIYYLAVLRTGPTPDR